jgi:hypothetical protein
VRAQAAGDEGLEVFAGEALVPKDDLPGADQMVITFQQGAVTTSRSPMPGRPRPQMTGMPSAVVIRYSY